MCDRIVSVSKIAALTEVVIQLNQTGCRPWLSQKRAAQPTKTKSKTQKARTPSSIVWFEIPADNPERARNFYGKLFGWKIKKFPGKADYWHIDTGGSGGKICMTRTAVPQMGYLSSARTRKTTCSPFGKRMEKQNKCPAHRSSFVVLLNG